MPGDDLAELSELDRRLLAAIEERFPVAQSPYCDLGAELGVLETDTLDSVLKLRGLGEVQAIAAEFDPGTDRLAFSDEDAALAAAITFDLPWGEHPYAEIAAQLALQGIERDEAWVLARLQGWLDDGTVARISARR